MGHRREINAIKTAYDSNYLDTRSKMQIETQKRHNNGTWHVIMS